MIITLVKNHKMLSSDVTFPHNPTRDVSMHRIILSFFGTIHKHFRQLSHKNISGIIIRTSFCCTKKLKKFHLFLAKVAKSCIYSQTLKTTVIYSSDLFTYNAKYLQTLLREKWRSFANSLRSMLKLRFTVHEVVSQPLRHK